MKVFALSKEFFLCGWNIFDLCIVTASILDLIFELVDGLSVLRGLRLVSFLSLSLCHPPLIPFNAFNLSTVKSFKTSTIMGHNASSS